MKTAVVTMKALQVSQAGGPWEPVERNIPEPGFGEVRIKVEACGVCHSDAMVKEGKPFPIAYPRIPGHEIAGTIDAVGEHVAPWKTGDRVGVGWHGGHDFICDACRRGDFMLCTQGKITGISYDGGYEQYMIAPAEALAAIPPELSYADAAPLMCAGITVYNSMRNSKARAGDRVAIFGIGGLGHLAVQFASKMGFNTVAIARGKDRESLARELGARHYIDSTINDPIETLAKMGGAQMIVATAPDAAAMSNMMNGLGNNGQFLLIGAPVEPLSVSAAVMIGGRRSIQGWPSGTAKDIEDTLQFSALTGIRPMIEKFPFTKAAEAYEKMTTGKVRFRSVIVMNHE